jgi:hypothetical protein
MTQIFEDPIPASSNREAYDDAHGAVVMLYDLADALTDSASDARARFPEEQMEMIAPLVETIIDTADTLSQQFCDYTAAGATEEAAKKMKIRPVFQGLFKAVDACLERLHHTSAEVAENITAVVMPAVEALVSHTEKLFTKLTTLVERTRDHLKKKTEFHAMIAREAFLASMMQRRLAVAVDPVRQR